MIVRSSGDHAMPAGSDDATKPQEKPQSSGRKCIACGRWIRGRRSDTAETTPRRVDPTGELLCAACWKASPAGRAADAERMRRRRSKETQP